MASHRLATALRYAAQILESIAIPVDLADREQLIRAATTCVTTRPILLWPIGTRVLPCQRIVVGQRASLFSRLFPTPAISWESSAGGSCAAFELRCRYPSDQPHPQPHCFDNVLAYRPRRQTNVSWPPLFLASGPCPQRWSASTPTCCRPWQWTRCSRSSTPSAPTCE